ncbi:MAG: hypothetical protein AB1894_11020 [Chloroflexota bacterium]
MRKVQFAAVFWTLFLAIPLTALALSGLAYVTDHMNEIMAATASFSQTTSVGGRGWVLEFSERWPEVAGMIVGQLVILAILLLARRTRTAESNNNQK